MIAVSVRRRMKADGVRKLEPAIRSGTTPERFGAVNNSSTNNRPLVSVSSIASSDSFTYLRQGE